MITDEVGLRTTVPVRVKLNPVYLSTQLAKKRPSSPTNLSCSRKVSLSHYVLPKESSITSEAKQLLTRAGHLFWNKVFSLKDRDTSSAAYTCCTISDWLQSRLIVWFWQGWIAEIISIVCITLVIAVLQLTTRGLSLCSDRWKIASTMTSSLSSLTSLDPVSHVSAFLKSNCISKYWENG